MSEPQPETLPASQDASQGLDAPPSIPDPSSIPNLPDGIPPPKDIKILETVEDIQHRRDEVLNRYKRFKSAAQSRWVLIVVVTVNGPRRGL